MSKPHDLDSDPSLKINYKYHSDIEQIMPNERKAYFRDIELKHFDPEKGVGSLFTEDKDLMSLLEKAASQRDGLSGDDRQEFINMGVTPEALLKFCRYLKVETSGEVGIVKVKDLSPNTKVKVVRTKQGAPCSLVIEGKEFPKTNFGTIIIGPNQKPKPEDPEPSTTEMVWTVHPGLPVKPATEDIWPEGSEITVKDIIYTLGTEVFLNVKKVA